MRTSNTSFLCSNIHCLGCGRRQRCRRQVKQETRSKKQEEGGEGISPLPGRGLSQQLEAWLRVPGEDDVPW